MSRYLLWKYRRRCRRMLARAHNEVLKSYLTTGPEIAGSVAGTPMIAVDLELTGLRADQHHIVSIGWVLIDKGRVRLGSSRHLLVRSKQSVGGSATVHELLDHELEAGSSYAEAIQELLKAAGNRIWVFHHALLDVAFIQTAVRRWSGSPEKLPMLVLDTLDIELRRRQRDGKPVQTGELKLGRLRSRYRLPDYQQHNSAVDALATAELILAMLSGQRQDGSLRHWLRLY